MKRYFYLMPILFCGHVGFSQTIIDGVMMAPKSLCTGFIYTHDQWRNYWEGGLKRDNLNLGTVSTQSVMWYGVYGLNSKVNLIGMVPYVWTNASMGTLTGMKGIQDLTLAAKYNFFQVASSNGGTFKAFATGTFSTPLTNYTPDFLPLSIGLGSTNLSGRLTANYALSQGWLVNVTGAYTWRSNVYLDRPAYFTDGTLYSTNEVQMPNLVDFTVDFGYHKGKLQGDLFFTQQNTLAGGDIRRQDMPFVSNRMNYSKIGAVVMYYLTRPRNFVLRGMVSEVVTGRNVGQTHTVQAGILYTFNFKKEMDNK